jgi:hypothetical protein
MKKRVATAVVFLCVGLLPGVLLAQANHYLGFKGGLSVPKLRGGNDELTRDYESRLDFTGGLVYEYQVNERFSVVSEFLYSGQGGKREGLQPVITTLTPLPLPPGLIPPGGYLYANFRNETKLRYLEWPVMAKLRWGSGWRFFANAGGYGGYLVASRTETRGQSTLYLDPAGTQPLMLPEIGALPAQDFAAKVDSTADLHRWNLGFTGGGGLEKPLSHGKLVLEGRASLGFLVLQRDPANGSSRTGNLVFTLAYTLPLKK